MENQELVNPIQRALIKKELTPDRFLRKTRKGDN